MRSAPGSRSTWSVPRAGRKFRPTTFPKAPLPVAWRFNDLLIAAPSRKAISLEWNRVALPYWRITRNPVSWSNEGRQACAGAMGRNLLISETTADRQQGDFAHGRSAGVPQVGALAFDPRSAGLKLFEAQIPTLLPADETTNVGNIRTSKAGQRLSVQVAGRAPGRMSDIAVTTPQGAHMPVDVEDRIDREHSARPTCERVYRLVRMSKSRRELPRALKGIQKFHD